MKSKTHSRRNPAIELYRVLLMFGICLLHAAHQCGHDNPCVLALMLPCVNGFVFISGWFGINFSFRGLLKLVANAVYAGVLAVTLVWMFFPEYFDMSVGCWRSVRYAVIGQWFFLAYAALMLVAPSINFIVERLDCHSVRKILPPLVLLFLLNAASDLPGLCHLRYPSGFGSYTPLSLACTYVVARLVRRYDVFSRLLPWHAVAGTIVLAVVFCSFPSLYLSCYASPLAIVFAALLFYLFSRLSPMGCKWINVLAPSMFTVYLCHSNDFGFAVMTKLEDGLWNAGLSAGVCYLLTALFAFVVGLAVDIPRRLIVCGVSALSRSKDSCDYGKA